MIGAHRGALVDTLSLTRAIYLLRVYAEEQAFAGFDATRTRQLVSELHDAYIAATGEEP